MTSMTQRPLIVAFHGTAAHSPVTTWASIPVRGGANELSGKFLGSTELGAAISHVMAGRDIRCAVAFWGTGASAHLFPRSEEHTSELQSLMRTPYAVFCLKQKTARQTPTGD